MKKNIFILPFLISLVIIYTCSSNLKGREDTIKFRLLPCDYITNEPYKKPALLRIYAIETSRDTADIQLIAKADSFVCERLKDSINPNKYSSLIIRFLKETELTKELNNNSITDSHNPLSSEHFRFVEYNFSNEGGTFLRWINNAKRLDKTPLPCK